MTIKFLKEWGQHLDGNLERRSEVQRGLDGGGKITRYGKVIEVDVQGTAHVFVLESPGRAVKFAAALNKLRRPLRLIKQDLDRDWAERVKERDNQTCALCVVQGDKVKAAGTKDVLTAHHWLKTKARAGMARWARACGVTVHYAEHIHTLHENPCWVDLEKIYRAVAIAEGEEAIKAALALVSVEPTEARVRALWLERCGNKKAEVTE
jgi:hypothetical protein